MRNKIAIIGVGNVGASCALWLAQRNIADLVLVDIPAAKTMPVGKGLDLLQAGPIVGYNTRIRGNADGSYEGTENSDILIITGGLPRKPGMSREDLVGANQAVITDVIDKALPLSPNAIIIVVTNPLDTMTYLALKHSKLPKQRVGGHGDEMVPLTRYSTVFGRPLTEWFAPDKLNAIVERTRKGGGEIVNLLGTSAYYAPGAALAKMAEAILLDSKLIVPGSTYLEGEYGLKDICFGVPVKLGAKGIEEII